MKLKILNFICRFIQIFIVVFVTDRMNLNFWAKFGILVVLFLIYDEAEPYLSRLFKSEPLFTEEDSPETDEEW